MQEKRPSRAVFVPLDGTSSTTDLPRALGHGPEERLVTIRCVAQSPTHQVGVDLERHARIAMAGDAGQGQDVGALSDEDTDGKVAKAVPAEVRQASPRQRRLELP